MKIDYDYINKIFKVFLDAETPTVDWEAFSDLRGGDSYDDKFIFHIRLMSDKHLISDTYGNSSMKSLGIISTMTDYVINITQWRLTADGHDFSSAITKPAILTTITEKFKEDGLSVVIDIAKQLVQKQAEKLLGE